MSGFQSPLGCPGRYSLTPGLQRIYRKLVARAVASGSAMVYVTAAACDIGLSRCTMHHVLRELIERGFVERHGHGIYALSEPVMDFKPLSADRRAA